MDGKMTVEEVITETIKILRSMVVPAGMPVEMAAGIAKPIMDAIHNLSLCVDAINGQNAEQEEQPAVQPEEI